MLYISLLCYILQSEDKADLAHPVKSRGCTDLLVLLIFVLFWAGMVSLGKTKYEIMSELYLYL